MNGFPIVRAICILLGAFSVILLLTRTGAVQYQAWFNDLLRYAEGIVLELPLDVVKKAILDPVLQFFRSIGWQLPALNEGWRNVFVLNTLLLSALARHHWRAGGLMIWTPLSALIGAVVSGLWPVAGISAGFLVACLLFFAVAYRVLPKWRRDLSNLLLAAIIFAAVSIFSGRAVGVLLAAIYTLLAAIGLVRKQERFALVFAVYAIVFFVFSWWRGSTLLSANLDLVAVFVVAAAALFILLGIRDSRRKRYPLRDDTEFNVGLDILAVMGISSACAAYMADPPLW